MYTHTQIHVHIYTDKPEPEEKHGDVTYDARQIGKDVERGLTFYFRQELLRRESALAHHNLIAS